MEEDKSETPVVGGCSYCDWGYVDGFVVDGIFSGDCPICRAYVEYEWGEE